MDCLIFVVYLYCQYDNTKKLNNMGNNLMTNEQIKLINEQINATLKFKQSVNNVQRALSEMLYCWVALENLDIIPETDCPFPFCESLDDAQSNFTIYCDEINSL